MHVGGLNVEVDYHVLGLLCLRSVMLVLLLIPQQSKAYASKSLAAKFISLGCVVLLVYGTLPNKVALPVQV